jgi:MFS family permease
VPLQVLTSIGFTSLILSIDVITADTSSLRDRGLAYAYTSSPYMITAFAGSKAAEGFYDTNWRWGYGAFTIILPFVAAPLFGILQFNKKKAEKKGLLKHVASGRTFQESVWHYVIEFDREYSVANDLSDNFTYCANIRS